MLALVTGGDRGIGFAISEKLAENGTDVIIAARDKTKLDKAKKELEKAGVKCWALHCDLTKEKSIENLGKEVSKIGKIDLLVNNAGVAYSGSFLENTSDEIDEMITTNLTGLIKCTKAFLPGMVKRKKGIIINISSGAGKSGIPGLAVYCSTKFGVIGFTEALAGEVEGKGVRVYAICPGGTQTDMWESLFPGARAGYVPEDVAIEVMELLKNIDKIRAGRAIDVRKHI